MNPVVTRFVIFMALSALIAAMLLSIEFKAFKDSVFDPNCLNCHAPATSIYEGGTGVSAR